MNMVTKKAFFSMALLVIMLALFDGTGLSQVLAAGNSPISSTVTTDNATTTTAPIQVPAGTANPAKVYFTDYSQFVANPLLRFWRLNGRFDAFGGPMSHVIVDQDGNTVQFFQKMALAYYPQLANTTWEVRPYALGSKFLASQPADIQTAAPFAPVAASANTKTQKFFSETGHLVANGFYDLYNKTGGLFVWGYPISEEYETTAYDGQNYKAQLFERGRMLWSQETNSIIDPNFGTQMAATMGVDTSTELNPDPMPGQAKIPTYNSTDWAHWVDVNLTIQSETFYEGDVPVRTSLVTTGTTGHETPTGDFHILRLVYNEHMKGGSIGAGDYYDLYNVLYTMYFTDEGHALHYAWWRSRFGVTGSHGCVNEDLATSAFAWNFLSLGSLVHIHY